MTFGFGILFVATRLPVIEHLPVIMKRWIYLAVSTGYGFALARSGAVVFTPASQLDSGYEIYSRR
jgi:hypothetical protein